MSSAVTGRGRAGASRLTLWSRNQVWASPPMVSSNTRCVASIMLDIAVAPTWRRERNQPRRARRRSRIAIHSNGVLRPHFGVLRLSDRDRRRVLTEKIGRNQRHHQNPIRRNHRRRHRHHKSGLISRRGRRGLHPRLLGPRRGLAQPGHIRRGRRHHRQRRRTHPRRTGQLGYHRRITGRSQPQLHGHPVPGRGRSQHRPRPRTAIHTARIDLRR